MVELRHKRSSRCLAQIESALKCRPSSRTALRRAGLLPLLDHEALHHATEIAASVGEARHRQPGALRPDPALGIEQDPLADRLAREIDTEIGIDEGPLPKVERCRRA